MRLLPAIVGPRQVHHRAVEVGTERIRVPQVGKTAGQSNEGIVGQVLREPVVPGDEVGKANRVLRVAPVELLEATNAPPVTGARHDRFLWLHEIWTSQDR